MPGIAGIFTEKRSTEGPLFLDAMLQSMMHETFYTCTSHVDQSHGWFCGSIAISGSYADCMPVFNKTHDVILFLAGECFCDSKMMTSHDSRDYRLDPKHLVRLYEEEGPEFVGKLNGWFSGVVLDAKRSRVVLFTDRYGIQKVYYYKDKGLLVFASEAKALLRVLPTLKTVDSRSIAEYLCFDCVLEDRTYFRNVNTLPGGSLLVHHCGIVEKRCYFDPANLEQSLPLDEADFMDQLTRTFESILPRYLAGSRVAIALTGGLDTRLIMACLPSDCGHITALTFGGMYRDSQDVRLAKEIARTCGIDHNVIRLDEGFLSEYPQHAARTVYISDGQTDATMPDLVYLDNCAREIAPIKLMGMFGSEVLGKERRVLRSRLPDPELIAADFKPHIDAASEALASFRQEHDLSYTLKREIPWYWSRFTVAQMSQLTIRSPFLDNDFVDLLYSPPREGFDGSKFELDAISRSKHQLLDIRTNRGICGKSFPLISAMLGKLIRARGLADKTLNWDILPYSLHHAVTKADSLILSPLHLNRVVFGFEYYRHYNLWFRRELAPYLQDTLLDARTLARPYWNAPFVRKMVKDHVSGHRRYLSEIRKVLTVELIHRVLIEGDT